MKGEKTFEDTYVETDLDTKCEWKDDGSKNKEWKGWMKVTEGVCRVVKWPATPYPATVTTWKEIKAWRKANPTEWKAYRKSVNEAWKNADMYYPYDKTKCEALKGRKSTYMRVERKRTVTKELKYCLRSYPGEDDGGADGDDDNTDDDDEKDDDSNDDDDKKDDDSNDDDDKKDDDSTSDVYGSGEVPDPAREKL